MDSQRILITGGCGFLGQHLLTFLSSHLSDDRIAGIHILDLKTPTISLFDCSGLPKISVSLNRDICRYDTISDAFKGVDCVIHLAGLVSFAYRDKDKLYAVNVKGTANVLRGAREHGVKRFIHISSVAALGYVNNPNHPVNEDFKFDWTIAERKHKYYMLSKHLADDEVNQARKAGLSCITLYPGLMFGPGDVTNSARLIEAIRKGKIPFIMPGGTNIVDVRDVSRGIANVVLNTSKEGDFLLSGFNLTFRKINQVIAEQLDVRPPRRTLSRRCKPVLFPLLLTFEKLRSKPPALTADNLDSAFVFRYFDNARARQELDWKPEIDFEQTIRDTIAWMRANGQLER
ncbi:MAG: NAD-dependent epimerase/dehydratase family protein [Sedimentisphaerales bacterium]|nr:NAD-dependent epimerase/dehydratase family protein [Sedimentisphaerales bacterium]